MDTWEQLQQECQACRKCSLCQERTQVVFGRGSQTAELLLIGEGPGANEDLQGKPFVGRAGKLLDDMLAMIGLTEEQVYIANIVKCRPPQNRDPLNTEQDACMPYLERQIALLQPKIIVCLGRIAAARILREDFKISQEHGKWFDCHGIPAMALYHPAALLRDPRKKPETFEDLKTLQQKIEAVCEHTSCDWRRLYETK